MNILKKLLDFFPFKENRLRRAHAHNLYVSLVTDARNPTIYNSCNIADSVDGRFDMVVLYLSLVLNRLKDVAEAHEGDEAKVFEKLSQELIGTYNNDMDRNLREMGVGDLSVGKHVKKMAKAFYGRLLAYDEALKTWDADKDPAKMKEALTRNIYRGEAAEGSITALLEYVAGYRKHLNKTSENNLKEGLLPQNMKNS